MGRQLVIGIDVDGVVANQLAAWVVAYNAAFHDNLQVDAIRSWAFHEWVKPECGAQAYALLTADLYDSIQPISGALEGVKMLREWGHRVIFVTSNGPLIGGAKEFWLIKHGFLEQKNSNHPGLSVGQHPDFVTANDKSLIKMDILVDDYKGNVEKPGPALAAIMFPAPHNRTLEYQGASDGVYNSSGWGGPRSVISLVNHIAFQQALEVAPHVTEQKFPIQVAAFRREIEEMYVTHLNKNADYSPANLLGTGELGVGVRLWDKVARLLSLEGIEIVLENPVFDRPKLSLYLLILLALEKHLDGLGFHLGLKKLIVKAPKKPKNESIEDTLGDLAVYGIAGKLLRRGEWGK